MVNVIAETDVPSNSEPVQTPAPRLYDITIKNYALKRLKELSSKAKDKDFPCLTDAEILEQLIERYGKRSSQREDGTVVLYGLLGYIVIDKTGNTLEAAHI